MSIVIQNQRMLGWAMPWGSGRLLLSASRLLFPLKRRNWSLPRWKDEPVVSQPAQILGASQSQPWGSPLTSLSAEGLGGRGWGWCAEEFLINFIQAENWLGQEMYLKHIFKLIFSMQVLIKPGWRIIPFYFTYEAYSLFPVWQGCSDTIVFQIPQKTP